MYGKENVACREGKRAFCENSKGVVKGLAEYVVAPYENVYKLTADMDLKDASLCEPLACCIHGAEPINIVPGESIALIGFGSIGIMMLQILYRLLTMMKSTELARRTFQRLLSVSETARLSSWQSELQIEESRLCCSE